MQNIALIELYRHSEVVRGLAQLLLHAGYQLSIFTNEKVMGDLNLVQMHPIKWYVQKSRQSRLGFLKKHLSELSSFDLLIFVTLASDFREISQLKLPVPGILLIHNGNTFIAPQNHFTFYKDQNIKNGLMMLKFFMSGRYYWQQKAIQSFEYQCFTSNYIHEHLKAKCPEQTRRMNLIPPLPFGFYEGNITHETKSSAEIIIVVPARIHSGIRDYNPILTAFKNLKNTISKNVKLVLLGAPKRSKEQELVKQFLKLKNDKIDVVTFDSIVQQEVYDNWLKRSDFLILPLRDWISVSGISEQYGYTNISGTITDLLRFCKPALMTPHYPLPDELEQLTERYHSADELADKLYNWIENETYNLLSRRAPELLKNSTLEKRAAILTAILTPILSR